MPRINSHDDEISVVITIQDPIETGTDFSRVVFIGTDLNIDGTAERNKSYTRLSALTSDFALGYLSADVLAAGTVFFAQPKFPDEFIVVNRDFTGSAETYVQALAAVLTLTQAFYAVTIDSRASADILAVAADVETNNHRMIFIFQNADAAWKLAAFPATFAALEGLNRSFGVWHEDDSQWADVAVAASRLAFNPDEKAPNWQCSLAGISSYTTAVTQAEKDALRDHPMNFILPLYNATDYWLSPGLNMNDLPMYQIVTADWYADRLEKRIAALQVAVATRGSKVPLNITGQAMIQAEAEAQFAVGVAAQHFEEGQYTVTTPDITLADIAAGQIRVEGAAKYLNAARSFAFAFDFGQVDVVNNDGSGL